MAKYTDKKVAEIARLYHTNLPKISSVDHPTSWTNRKTIIRNARYLLEYSIPTMRQTIPEGCLREFNIDLDSLEERCKEILEPSETIC